MNRFLFAAGNWTTLHDIYFVVASIGCKHIGKHDLWKSGPSCQVKQTCCSESALPRAIKRYDRYGVEQRKNKSKSDWNK